MYTELTIIIRKQIIKIWYIAPKHMIKKSVPFNKYFGITESDFMQWESHF